MEGKVTLTEREQKRVIVTTGVKRGGKGRGDDGGLMQNLDTTPRYGTIRLSSLYDIYSATGKGHGATAANEAVSRRIRRKGTPGLVTVIM
jgi:hypothetical protein